jgi:choline dehydrogenase-like flavoprotein
VPPCAVGPPTPGRDGGGQCANRVTLSDEVDHHGLRVADFLYPQRENDRAQVKAATGAMTDMPLAAGASEAITINRYAHLVGGCRMAANQYQGVVDRDLRSFAVENLYIVDGSVFLTQGSANNPALTVMTLASPAAEHLATANRRWTA